MQISPEDLTAIVEGVWTGALAFDVVTASAEPGTNEERITGTISICGDWNGLLMIDCPLPLASQAAERMMSIPSGELVLDDLRDTVAELTNMLGGGVKSVAPGTCKLALPCVTTGIQHEIMPRNTDLVTDSQFRVAGLPLRLRVWQEV